MIAVTEVGVAIVSSVIVGGLLTLLAYAFTRVARRTRRQFLERERARGRAGDTPHADRWAGLALGLVVAAALLLAGDYLRAVGYDHVSVRDQIALASAEADFMPAVLALAGMVIVVLVRPAAGRALRRSVWAAAGASSIGIVTIASSLYVIWYVLAVHHPDAASFAVAADANAATRVSQILQEIAGAILGAAALAAARLPGRAPTRADAPVPIRRLS